MSETPDREEGPDPDPGPNARLAAQITQGLRPEATPEEATPSGAELVIPPDADEHEVFVVLDRHDELAVMEEMQRRSMDVMLYEFPQDGSNVCNLNVIGVRECIAQLNRTGKCRIGNIEGSLRCEEVTEEHTQEGDEDIPPVYIQATVWARDELTGQTRFGVAVQAKYFKPSKGKRKGKVTWDRFALTKAANKAERNAQDKFIPEPLRQLLIAQYLKQPERVKTIQAGAGAEEMAQLPPPLNDDEAKALRGEAEKLWLRLRELNPIVKPPGWYHQGLLHSQGSHEALRGFVARIAELVKYEEGKSEQ